MSTEKTGNIPPEKVVSLSDSWNAAKERTDNVIGQRLAAERKRRGLPLESLREQLQICGVDIQIQGLSKWEKGVTVPNAYQFIAICRVLGIEDHMVGRELALLNDEGLRKLDEYKMDLIASGRYRPVQKCRRETYIEMPVSTLAVSAGTGEILDEGGFEMICFPQSAVPDNADFGVRVHGDSMEPVYHDGQIVWIQKCEHLSVGEVGIFVYDGEGYLKAYSEVEPDEDDIGSFTDSDGCVHSRPVLVSYNSNYDPRIIKADTAFQIIGRVL